MRATAGTKSAAENTETKLRGAEEAHEMCPVQTHLAQLDPYYHYRFGYSDKLPRVTKVPINLPKYMGQKQDY